MAGQASYLGIVNGPVQTNARDLALIEHWDDTRWSVEATPNANNGERGHRLARLSSGQLKSPRACNFFFAVVISP
jgi:hypothetical protein